jgi:hypothetical protein
MMGSGPPPVRQTSCRSQVRLLSPPTSFLRGERRLSQARDQRVIRLDACKYGGRPSCIRNGAGQVRKHGFIPSGVYRYAIVSPLSDKDRNVRKHG